MGVADSDTITVLGAGNRQTRVRLQGIDAPKSQQTFGQVSKQNLSDLFFDRQVVVEYEKTNRHGQTLGKMLAGGHNVNLEQIRAGLALTLQVLPGRAVAGGQAPLRRCGGEGAVGKAQSVG
ncbi:MAG: thermonuclease family protein [Pyrinomonadaceae bacterium]